MILDPASSRYVGLARHERGTAWVVTGAAFAMFALLLGRLGDDNPDRVPEMRPPLTAFAVPLLTPVAEAEPIKEPRPRQSEVTVPKPRAAASGDRLSNIASPPAQALNAPPVAVAPGPTVGVTVDGPPALPIAAGVPNGVGLGGGTGVGLGTGDGTGQGAESGGETARYARATWIERPSPADIRRSWPVGITRLDSAVTVLIQCSVRRNGRPYRCKLADDGGNRQGFAAAGLRLVQLGRVQPVLRDGRATDLPVLIPFTFLPDRRSPAAETGIADPRSRVATDCLKPVRTIALKNVCDFAVDVAFCIDTPGNPFSCGLPGGRVAVNRTHLPARARFEWPSELQRLRMKPSEQIALMACRHEPADPVEPRFTSTKPATGQCV